jgi:hypothetical protein
MKLASHGTLFITDFSLVVEIWKYVQTEKKLSNPFVALVYNSEIWHFSGFLAIFGS